MINIASQHMITEDDYIFNNINVNMSKKYIDRTYIKTDFISTLRITSTFQHSHINVVTSLIPDILSIPSLNGSPLGV